MNLSEGHATGASPTLTGPRPPASHGPGWLSPGSSNRACPSSSHEEREPRPRTEDEIAVRC